MSNQWLPFTGQYEKQFYDIKLHDGHVLEHCWPNADTFHTDMGVFAASLVKEYRVCVPTRGDITNDEVRAFTEDLYAIQSMYRKLETNHPKVFKAYDGEWRGIIEEDARGIDNLVEKAGDELWDMEAERQ